MKRSIGALVVVSVCGWAPSAFGEAPPKAKQVRDAKHADRGAERPDRRAEAEPARESAVDQDSLTLFRALDLDGDGRVSREELEACIKRHVSKRVALRFEQLDRNGDGRVPRAEVAQMRADRFARLDANGNGFFTRAELERLMIALAKKRLTVLLARMDTDRDRACTYAELNRHRHERIAARDRRDEAERREVAAGPQKKSRRSVDHARVRRAEAAF